MNILELYSGIGGMHLAFNGILYFYSLKILRT